MDDDWSKVIPSMIDGQIRNDDWLIVVNKDKVVKERMKVEDTLTRTMNH